MRIILLILAFILFSLTSFGQKPDEFYLDELCISVNKANVKDKNTRNEYGFGFSAKHNVKRAGNINILFGLDYNHTSQLKHTMVEGDYMNSTDVTYLLDYLSFPLTARITYGEKVKVFFETGLYVELSMSAERSGIMHRYSQSQQLEKTYKFHDNIGILVVNCGPSFGIGLRIPVSRHEMIVKTDYNYGLIMLGGSMNEIFNRYFQLALGYKI